jgi:hypothetical protein
VTESSLLQFDDPPRGAPADGQPATERIAATLKSAGIDAPNSLYDEALGYARDGHLGQAQARLQMLLCLDPDDADALLLMARVHLAQGRPVEALARVDAAVAAGGIPVAGFREQLEAAIRAERAREEEHRSRIAAREQGEIRSLRNETRTLRSEQVRLETEVTESRLRERNWKYAALGTSVLATFVILLLVFARAGGGGGAPEVAPVAARADAVMAETPPAPAAPAAVVGAPTAKVETPPASAAKAPTAAQKAAAVQAVAEKPAAEKPAKAANVATANMHVVGSGDTLERLAQRYYGDKTRWEEIRDANKKTLKGGIALDIGMKLKIP